MVTAGSTAVAVTVVGVGVAVILTRTSATFNRGRHLDITAVFFVCWGWCRHGVIGGGVLWSTVGRHVHHGPFSHSGSSGAGGHHLHHKRLGAGALRATAEQGPVVVCWNVLCLLPDVNAGVAFLDSRATL